MNDDFSIAFWRLWKNDFWGQTISGEGSHKSYRPITILSYRIDFLFGGNTNPFPYHFFNDILHAINCWLVFKVTKALLNLKKGNNSIDTITEYTALGAALLFSTHPIHTEAVSGLVGRAETLCAMFSMISFLFYISNWFWTSILFTFIATLSKELGLTTFAILFLWEIFVGTVENQTKTQKRKISFWKLSCQSILLVAFLSFRSWLTVDFTVRIYRHVENPLAWTHGIERILSTMYLHTFYLGLLVYPVHLSADYSFNCIPLVESFLDKRIILILMAYGSIFGLGLLSLWQYYLSVNNNTHNGNSDTTTSMTSNTTTTTTTTKHKKQQHQQQTSNNGSLNVFILFCLAFLIFPFVPAMNIFMFVGTFVAERLLYIPSIGFCIFLSYVFVQVLGKKDDPSHWRSKLAWNLLLVLFVLYGIKTWIRNYDWKDEERLMLSALDVCPNSAKVQSNVGVIWRRYQEWDKALSHFHLSQEIEPTYCDADHWIGLTYVNRGNVTTGIQYLRRGLHCKWIAVTCFDILKRIYETLPKENPYIEQYAEVLAEAEFGMMAAVQYRDAASQYWNEKNWKEGLRVISIAHKFAGDDEKRCLMNIFFWFGEFHAQLGNVNEAFAFFSRGAQCPTSEGQQRCVQYLDLIKGLQSKKKGE